MKENRYKWVWAFVLSALLVSSLMAVDFRYVTALVGKVKGDRLGTVMASIGDINRDGYQDLAVSAMGSYTVASHPGEVYIYLGGKKFKGTPDITIKGEGAGDHFGEAVAALGDINGDGYDDFAVGAPRNDDAYPNAGKVYIFYGGKVFDGKPALSLTGSRANDWFGVSIAGGMDINADKKPDIIIGASYGGKNYGGAAYLFIGGATPTNPALVLDGENPGDGFGDKVVMLGDVSGDGIADFAVAASYYDESGVQNVGAVYIFKGGSVVSKNPFITLTGKNADENFGYDVSSAGDFNGDGINDIVVGSIAGGPDGQGIAAVYLGGQVIRPNPFLEIIGEHTGDMTGHSVCSAGDMNKDGFSDIMVGSPYSDMGYYRNGRVDLYLGGAEADRLSDFHILGDRNDAQCGFAIAAVPHFFGKRGGSLYLVNVVGNEGGFSDISRVFVFK